MQRADEKIH